MLRSALFGLVSAAVLAAACGTSLARPPVGTEFTYQGQLLKNGQALTGPADFRFTLFDGPGPTALVVGAPQNVANVTVTAGRFECTINFGESPYTTNEERWLQVEVRNPAGGGVFSLMGDRQKLTASPFSLATRGINVDALGRVTLTPTGPGSQNDVSFAVTAANAGMLSSLAVSNGGFQNRLETLVDATSAGNPGGVTLRVHSPGIAWGRLNLNPTGNVVLSEQEGSVGIGMATPNAKLSVRTGVAGVNINPPTWTPLSNNAGLITITDQIGAERGFLGVSREPEVDTVLAATGGGTNLRLSGDSIRFFCGATNSAIGNVLSTGVRPTAAMVLDFNGNLGIGSGNNPTRGKVEISGSSGSSSVPNPHGFMNTFGAAQGLSAYSGATSLHASGDIHASVFRAFSDSRIKNIAGRSDAAKDLDTLQKIEITDYTFKDTIGKGAEPQKKVIGQQVEEVYPLAVRKTSDIIPDIYKKAPVQGGWVMLATDLKVGDKVRVIGMHEQTESTVAEVKDGGFRMANLPAGDEVFVYGREVSDFRTVDYEAIAMLNVSATQELARQNMAMQKQIEELELQRASVEARLAKLEAALAGTTTATASK